MSHIVGNIVTPDKHSKKRRRPKKHKKRGDAMFFSKPSGQRWYNRGDSNTEDFLVTDLTKDGDWHDMDLSGVIPKGTSLVLMRLRLNHTGANQEIRFRTKGHTQVENFIGQHTNDAMRMLGTSIMVQPDSDGIIQYTTGAAGTWLVITIQIKGWLK